MEENEIQLTRSASCDSLSGKGTIITYEVGISGDCKYFRLVSCTSSAKFCKDWISMVDIQQLLAGSPNLTSKTLQPVYAGKSANSPGFMLAALVHEKLCSTGKETSAPEGPPQKKPAKARKDTAKEIPT
jgi:hypothetical protein